MSKLSLSVAPTFKAKVGIPIAGGQPVLVELTFKHQTRSQHKDWLESLEGKSDDQAFLDIVSGWDLEDVFSPENVLALLENHMGAAGATYAKYREEITGQKAKN